MCARLALALFLFHASAQNFSELTLERVANGFAFTEGPVWSREGFLLFSDIPNNRILKLTPGVKGVNTYLKDTGGANGSTYDEKGRLYTCEGNARRVVRIDKKGNLEVIADKFEGKRLNGPNDVVVTRNGHVYFTDPAFGSQQDHRELDFYGLFHVNPHGAIEVIAKPKGRPNGIALSPDGKTLYVTNSDEKNVRAYDIERNGGVANERVVVADLPGVPDGMKVDEKGNLYIACKGLGIYSPEGKLLRMMEMSEAPSNVAFGDADWQSLFITARSAVYRVRLDVKGAVQY